MTVRELRILVENLDEYIHVPGGIQRLKRTILQLAVSGQLIPDDDSDSSGEELFKQIQYAKQKLVAEGRIKKQKPLSPIIDAELPFEIPKSWKWVRLGSLTDDISYGYTESASKAAVGPKFVRITDIQNGSINWATVPFCKISDKDTPKYLLEDGDILFARTGGTVGKSYICKNPPVSVFASYLIRVRAQKFIKPEYLLLYFDSESYWSSIYGDMSGTGQPNFNGTKLANLLIPLPSISSQLAIIEKVGQIFSLIDDLSRCYKAEENERQKLVITSMAKLADDGNNVVLDYLLELIKTKADAAELRKTILSLAVSGQLVPQKPQEGTGKDLYDQIQAENELLKAKGAIKKPKLLPEINESEIPHKIPKNWKWVRLGSISTYTQRGKSPKYSEFSDFPILSQRCVRRDHIDWEVVKFITPESAAGYENYRFLVDGDLLLNSTGTGTLGRACLYRRNPNYDRVVADSHVTVVRSGERIVPEFLHTCFNAPYIQNTVESNASGSTNQIEWNLSSIQQQLLPLPPTAEQHRIVQKVTNLMSLVSKLEQHLEK